MNYQPATILLVEDDDIDAIAVERAFRKLKVGNPIIRAKDGVSALQKLRAGEIEKPFMIILDLNLPKMGGVEFLNILRKDDKLDDSIVFILTTSKDQDDKLKAYKEHVAGYIVKEKLDTGFEGLIDLLDHYWRIVEFPSDP